MILYIIKIKMSCDLHSRLRDIQIYRNNIQSWLPQHNFGKKSIVDSETDQPKIKRKEE